VSRDFLARFQDERIAARDGEGIHPERNHRRKIKRRDARADAERLEDRLAVDVAREVLERVAEEEGRHAAGVFDVFEPAIDGAARFDEGLAVFAGNGGAELVEVGLDELTVAKKDAGPLGDRGCLAPRGKRGLGSFDCSVCFSCATSGTFGNDVAGRRIEDRRRRAAGLFPFAADVVGQGVSVEVIKNFLTADFADDADSF